MGLIFEIIEGVRKGARFKLRPGVEIGRKGGDISLHDPKVSKRHARVETGPDGEYYLVDLGSSNGIKVEGKKMDKIPLTPGIRVQIGKTFLKVITDQGQQEQQGPDSILRKDDWNEVLSAEARKLAQKVVSKPVDLTAFTPAVELKFIQGMQLDTSWVLGYGPRSIGKTSIDLPVFESEAPDECFKLTPERSFIRFTTSCPEKVRLNNSITESELIKDGDIVTIGSTKIQFNYLKAEEP